jgi:signal recognition particle receptor subunit beta
MSFVNSVSKEVNCKIVYVGTGLSGKTTNVQYIYENTQNDRAGKLVSLSTENERTLFFDFLPLSIGEIRGYKTRFHLYTIPGQTFYEASRDFILKGVDGVVFVVDSEPSRMEANLDAWDQFQSALERQGYDMSRIPLVFQYNKRDLPNAASIETFQPTRFTSSRNNTNGEK